MEREIPSVHRSVDSEGGPGLDGGNGETVWVRNRASVGIGQHPLRRNAQNSIHYAAIQQRAKQKKKKKINRKRKKRSIDKGKKKIN